MSASNQPSKRMRRKSLSPQRKKAKTDIEEVPDIPRDSDFSETSDTSDIAQDTITDISAVTDAEIAEVAEVVGEALNDSFSFRKYEPQNLDKFMYMLFMSGIPVNWKFFHVIKFVKSLKLPQGVTVIKQFTVDILKSKFPTGCCFLRFSTLALAKTVLKTCRRVKYEGSKIKVESVPDARRFNYHLSRFQVVLDQETRNSYMSIFQKPNNVEAVETTSSRLQVLSSWFTSESSPTETYGLEESLLKSLNIELPLVNTVNVFELDTRADKEKLREVFSLAGVVNNVNIIPNKEGNASNVARIEYEHPLEAVQAISMFDKQFLYGKHITVRMIERNAPKYLPEGLMSIGKGLGPNGEPIRPVRIRQEQQYIKEQSRFAGNENAAFQSDQISLSGIINLTNASNAWSQNNLLQALNTLISVQNLIQQVGENNLVANLAELQSQNIGHSHINVQNLSSNTPSSGQNMPNMSQNTPNLSQNTPNLSQKTPNMSQNTPNLSQNTPNLSQNTPNLGQYTPNLSQNTANLTQSTSNLSQNTQKLSQNTPNLSQNTPNVSQKTPNMSQNTPNLSQNTPNLSQNTPNLGQYTSNLSQNTANLSQSTSNLSQNTQKLSQNTPKLSQNMAKMGQIRPNMNQYTPNLSQNMPNMSQNGPNMSQNGPNVSQNTPMYQSIPKFSQNMPNLSQNMSNMSQNTPKLCQNTPNLCQNIPKLNQNKPGLSQNMSNLIQNVPNLSQNVPNMGQNRPNMSQNTPKLRQNIPNLSQNMLNGGQGLYNQHKPIGVNQQAQVGNINLLSSTLSPAPKEANGLQYNKPQKKDAVIVNGSQRDKNSETKVSDDAVILSCLPPSVTIETLNVKMRKVGELVFSKMTGPGTASVRFKIPEHAKQCIEMFHHSKVDGQVIEVKYS